MADDVGLSDPDGSGGPGGQQLVGAEHDLQTSMRDPRSGQDHMTGAGVDPRDGLSWAHEAADVRVATGMCGCSFTVPTKPTLQALLPNPDQSTSMLLARVKYAVAHAGDSTKPRPTRVCNFGTKLRVAMSERSPRRRRTRPRLPQPGHCTPRCSHAPSCRGRSAPRRRGRSREPVPPEDGSDFPFAARRCRSECPSHELELWPMGERDYDADGRVLQTSIVRSSPSDMLVFAFQPRCCSSFNPSDSR